ncbi:MAG: hypothetical protein JW866_01320 [Ignavibacteriales bacterium]|nr:hypothetical protein [Ignavibacteriales bacterium]
MNAMQNKISKERFNILCMKALDNEFNSDNEILEFQEYIKKIPEFKIEYEEFKRIKELTKKMNLRSPNDDIWKVYRMKIMNRIERSIAWIIFLAGCAIILAFGGYKAIEALLNNTRIDLILKIGIIATLSGGLFLLLSVIKEKITLWKSDPYKGIEK